MLCSFCGSASGNAGFCTSCGRALQISPPPPKAAEPVSPQTVTGQMDPVSRSAPVTPSSDRPATPPPQQASRSRDPRKRSRAIPVLVISLVAVVLLGGSGAALWWLYSDSGSPESSPSEARTDSGTYGSDPELDKLWDECVEGSLQSCDDLYLTAAAGSDYEQFGATCGNRGDGYGSCSILGGASNPADEGAFGSDVGLDLLWAECEDGDMTACDDLYLGSPVGSEYEEFGATCGGRGDATGECVVRYP